MEPERVADFPPGSCDQKRSHQLTLLKLDSIILALECHLTRTVVPLWNELRVPVVEQDSGSGFKCTLNE